jgi:UDPglucose 6-dehydrogenase
MKIGFIGIGKLGLPCAEAIAKKGHDVIGYDLI